jgi:hypothetical protein
MQGLSFPYYRQNLLISSRVLSVACCRNSQDEGLIQFMHLIRQQFG